MGTPGYAFIYTQKTFILQTPSGTLGMDELILNIVTVYKPKKNKNENENLDVLKLT